MISEEDRAVYFAERLALGHQERVSGEEARLTIMSACKEMGVPRPNIIIHPEVASYDDGEMHVAGCWTGGADDVGVLELFASGLTRGVVSHELAHFMAPSEEAHDAVWRGQHIKMAAVMWPRSSLSLALSASYKAANLTVIR